MPGADQAFRPRVKPLEIIGCVKEIGSPTVAEPAHVVLNRIDILLLFLGWVGVVEPQVTTPGKLLRDAEIQGNGFGMADVQVAVRLRREASHNLVMFVGVEIGLHDIANEIAPRLCRRQFRRHFRFLSGIQRPSANPA